jgi:ectoine hydroxylase-related dioxygenase (phytanoyl-CoA dioxygenase family)
MESTADTHGVLERLPANDPIDEVAAELAVNGWSVLPSGLEASAISALASSLEDIYAEQAKEMGGEGVLRQLKETDTARAALAYDPAFLKAATAAPLMSLCRRVLGSEFILLMQNGNMNRADREFYQTKWHRDLNYQHWLCTRTLAINALLCLDDFTETNGATFVLSGTHNVVQFPTPAFVKKFERQITAPAGSYLILNAMLFHRAGVNRSTSVRRAVNHVIGLPFLAQQIDLPSVLARRGVPPPQEPALAKYLGYRWSPAEDVTDWRSRRLT